MRTWWTVEFCNCGGFDYCRKCEMPCDHDQLCPQCRGYEWVAAKCRDFIDVIVAKDSGELFRTRREAMLSIENSSLA